MKRFTFAYLYKDVPPAQREQLRRFRVTHPAKRCTIAGAPWAYIDSREGAETLLLLPGGTRYGEAFETIWGLETAYRVIAPTYPLVMTMAELVHGLAGILQAEGIGRAHVLGASLGGMVAQCFVHQYPDLVGDIILANTGIPDARMARRWQSLLRLVTLLPPGVLRALARQRLYPLVAAAPLEERALLRAHTEELILRIPKAWYVCQFKLLIDFATNYTFAPDDLLDWRGRVLIVESGADELIPARAGTALKALYPQAQVHTFPVAGHVAALTNRAEFMTAVLEFLRAGAAARGASGAVTSVHLTPANPAC